MDYPISLQNILSLLPTQYVGDAVVILSFIISACALLARFWRGPAPGSKWAVVWMFVTALAQIRGTNPLSGRTTIDPPEPNTSPPSDGSNQGTPRLPKPPSVPVAPRPKQK